MPIFSTEDWSRELSRALEARGRLVDLSTFPSEQQTPFHREHWT